MTNQPIDRSVDLGAHRLAASKIDVDNLVVEDLVVSDLGGVLVDLTDHLEARAEQTFETSWVLPASSLYRGWRLTIKRAIDVVLSLVLIVLLAPVMACVALAVALESSGPVLFKQSRIGRGGYAFSMWKFRSMYTDAEERLASDPEMLSLYRANDYKFPESNDPRVTPLGGFLRKSSLDELPQLFSVLGGDMSLVGPRPVVPDELVRSRHGDAYVYATPGITGLWQVEGRSSVGYPERCDYDNRYVEQFSVWGDLWLLVRTIPAVLWCRGAH